MNAHSAGCFVEDLKHLADDNHSANQIEKSCEIKQKQECIPVRCVPSATVAVCWWGGGGPDPGGCLVPEGSGPRGCLLPGGWYPSMH